MFTAFKRIIKFGWQNFWRDRGIAAATIFILFINLALITFLFFLKSFSHYVTSYLEGKADISLYFTEETSEEEILDIQEELKKIPEIKEIKYVSRDQALEEFTERHKANPVLMEALEEAGVNPFLAALNIQAWEVGSYEKIANFLAGAEFKNSIERVDYYQRKGVIERIFGLSATIGKAVIIFSLIFAIVSILVVFNTVRLAILNQRQEIEIQRLVGASNWFIRGPFIVQGIISGFFAALICFLIFGLISWFLAPKIENLAPGFNLWQIFIDNFWTIIFIQLAAGIFLGVVSSSIAIRKYLKL